MRTPALTLLLAACGGEISLGDPIDSDVDDSGDAVDTGTKEPEVPKDTGPDDTAQEDTDQPEPVIDPRFDDAILIVEEPEPAGIYTLGEGVPLDGWVESADGDLLDAGDLRWTVGSVDFRGMEGNANVAAGVYDVDVAADLPNGDRLRTTIGGVRVQDELTGVYAGSVQIAAFITLQGNEVRSDCIGPLTFQIGPGGKQVNGSGGCLLSTFLTNPIDFTFSLHGTIDAPEVSGNLSVSALLISLPIPWEGEVTANKGLHGSFEADLAVARFEGRLDATRVATVLP